MAETSERKRRGGKKNHKHGRNRYGDPKCGPAARRYIDLNRRFANKLRRVEKHNGKDAARSYLDTYGGRRHETRSLVRRKK
jgi:hypothetical protein